MLQLLSLRDHGGGLQSGGTKGEVQGPGKDRPNGQSSDFQELLVLALLRVRETCLIS